MIKDIIIILGSLIIATILGVYGESIAYFMNKNIVKTAPVYYLTASTITSIIFYLLPIIYLIFKRKKIKEETLGFYLTFICFVGMLTSTWSLFVLAMWWG